MRPETTFFSRLTEAFARIAETLDASVTLHCTFMDENHAAAIAAHIRDPGFRRAGLVLAVPNHPLVRDALRRVHAGGLPIVQIVTASPGVEAPYVGIDNYAAGRMAGLLISRMQPRSGALIAFCHSAIYQLLPVILRLKDQGPKAKFLEQLLRPLLA